MSVPRLSSYMVDAVCSNPEFRHEARIVASRALNVARSIMVSDNLCLESAFAEALSDPEIWSGFDYLA